MMLATWKRASASLGVIAILLVHGAASAQEAPAQPAPGLAPSDEAAAEGDAVQGDIVVTGIRASLSKAQDIKRNSIAVVDAIAAQDIGKFPDQNVAESLQRVTGVSIDRSSGEGRSVTVRGFGPKFNTVLLNNRLLATENSGREFSFDILPSELISGAEVYKSSPSSLQDGGIGSTIVLRTARPLDSEGFRVVGSAGLNNQSNRGGVAPKASVVVSNANADRTFGILASLVYDKLNADNSRYSTSGWLPNQSVDLNRDGRADVTGVWIPQTSQYDVDYNQRERIGGTLSVDWEISPELKLGLDGLYTKLKRSLFQRGFGLYTDTEDFTELTKNENGSATGFTRRAAGTTLAIDNTLSERNSSARTYQLAGNLAWTPDDTFKISLDVAHSNAEETRSGYFSVLGRFNEGRAGKWSIDTGNGTPGYDLSTIGDPSDVNAQRMHVETYQANLIKDTVNQFSLDLEKKFEGTLTSLQAGVVGTNRRKLSTGSQSPDFLVCYYCGYKAGVPASLLGTFNVGPAFSRIGGPDVTLVNWNFDELIGYASSAPAVRAGAEYAAGQAGTGAAGAQALIDQFNATYAANGRTWTPINQTPNIVRENSISAYLQANLSSKIGDMPVTGVVGGRFVYTDVRSSGAVRIPVAYEPILQIGTLSDPTLVTDTNHYAYFLPSASFKLNLTDDVIARYAVSRTLTRPTLTDLYVSRSYGFGRSTLSATGGNPDLQPFLAWNLDAGADWFISRSSNIGATLFYKRISNFVSAVTTLTELIGLPFQSTVPTNANGGKVWGAEVGGQYTFDSLPAPFDGFGVSANYTYVRSSIKFDPALSKQVFNIEGLSDSANAVIFYEKGPIQLRAAYNWRDSFLALSFGAQGQPENVDGYGQYDISGSVKITDNLTVFAEAINLTNKQARRFSSFEERLILLEDTGRRVSFGLRGTF